MAPILPAGSFSFGFQGENTMLTPSTRLVHVFFGSKCGLQVDVVSIRNRAQVNQNVRQLGPYITARHIHLQPLPRSNRLEELSDFLAEKQTPQHRALVGEAPDQRLPGGNERDQSTRTAILARRRKSDAGESRRHVTRERPDSSLAYVHFDRRGRRVRVRRSKWRLDRRPPSDTSRTLE